MENTYYNNARQSSDPSKYFAAKKPDELAAILASKSTSWATHLRANGYLDKLRDMWLAYNGAYDSSVSDGHKITFQGEEGELTKLNVNHFRNLAQHLLVMITATRPAFQARATNTDYKSLVQTKLANSLLDYYLREKRLEKYLKIAAEMAIVMGSGYIKMSWDSTSGEAYEYNEETHTYIYEGDVQFVNLSPFDVVFDSTKEHTNHDWMLCRTFKNKFDLMAKYPEFSEKIQAIPSKQEHYKYRIDVVGMGETDDVAVWEFYHKKTESMPEGRYLMYLNSDVVLMDAPIPYRTLPIYRISPSDILGTSYGYSPMFDILPIQEAINSIYSTILSNNATFGVQNIYMPRGADIAVNQLAGGLNIIEGNAEPKPLQLTSTAPETYKLLEILEKVSETLSGVNSVSRGNPDIGLKSGNALALVQSMTLQFISGLQQSYVQLIEDVGTGLINILKDYAAVPRVAAISGRSNKTYMKEFNGSDLENVNRVIVDVGNPLARTSAGRVQMAEQLLQMKVLTSPEQYFQVIETGKLEVLTDNVNDELLLIKTENEHLVDDKTVVAIATDKHLLHINEHKSVLADPDLRQDPQLVARTLGHIQEHINLMRTVDPALLQIIGEQPLGPPGGTPPSGPQGGQGAPPASASPGVPLTPPSAQSVASSPENTNTNIPEPAKPPAPFQNLPTNPQDMG